MSGIALVLLDMGYKVSGSDIESSDLTEKIKADGGNIYEGHRASNLAKEVGLVVYSSSIPKENPEFKEALRRRIPVVQRAKVLGELLNRKKGIAVTGTHGKTTTTSLIATMFENLGKDPTVIIGGEVPLFKGNAKSGRGEYLVAEADESDGSFLHLKPFYSVITNIEMEHIDYYKTLGDAIACYSRFAGNTKKGGTLFFNHDDKNTARAIRNFTGRLRSFGFSDSSDIRPKNIRMNEFSSSYYCVYKGKTLGRVELSIPGRHNILNSLAAILVGLEAGFDFKNIAEAIKDFRGTKRRFDLRADADGVMLIDDYAHHPTEIRAVLDACNNWKNRRVIAVFQPHRYTRTLFLADEFGECFKGADTLILTDIYAASERPIKGVSVKNIYDKVKENGMKNVFMMKKEKIPGYILKMKKPGDMILVMGAGDVKEVSNILCENMNGTKGSSGKYKDELQKLIKGTIKFREPLSKHTTFRIGGPADYWVEPSDYKDLKSVLKFARSHKIPFFVLGGGSNVLARDMGFNGIIINLNAPYFKSVTFDGDMVKIGAGYGVPALVRLSCEKGLRGLESLVGIPGTVGGAICMNAGGWANPMFKNMGDVVRSLKVMDYEGNIKTLKREGLKFGYRTSNLNNCVILEAVLKLEKSKKDILVSSSSKFLKMKREKQVLDMPSAGCVFKNPVNFQLTCGQMIDMLGLKGKTVGGAQISEKHANFIINKKGAKCGDVLKLIEFVKDRVAKNYKVPLELEVKVI